ncbi:depupylase/deamidase Dop [Saxibacter everestensis]|uniref:Depupylase/deamidase Dop n=1 Tax=Saxibacter everestensis TaxID=2909229 RepID=A0ABY8QXA9_9MICO|nr:depupylase/deamidase Dop [Brevibacteriaceae bacterium ZFBP1038]
MSVHRVMGIETEYGVSTPGDPNANPMLMSSRVVHAYAAPRGLRPAQAHWDFSDETPLRDARGFEMSREAADRSQLTDEMAQADEPHLVNVVLPNGARLYVDHAHPEYSSPEVTNPLDAVRWDKAGEMVMLAAVRQLAGETHSPPVNLYKNNVDGKGSSYGTHENYLMPRSTPFGRIVEGVIPFFVSRQIFTGAGRLGIGQRSERSGFQISQRTDYFETEVGLETTLKRPIVNTRDEPHAVPDRYRRLHVIIGDANQSETATFLKMGATSLVLGLIENGRSPDIELEDPIQALYDIGHDTSCTVKVPLVGGQRLSAVELQRRYLDAAESWVGSDTDPQTARVLELWADVLDRLEDDPLGCSDILDWVAKLKLLQGFQERERLGWDSAKLALIDLQFADIRPEKGLFQKLAQRGEVRTLFDDAAIAAAVAGPPEDTRAYFRGRCVQKYGRNVAAASWDSVVFDVSSRPSLQRIPMLEPLRGTREHVGALLDSADTASELLDALTSP